MMIKRIYGQIIKKERELGLKLIQNYIYQVVTVVLALASEIVVARVIGPAGKGIFDLFSLLSSFILEIGSLGFSSGLLYFLANKGKPLREIHGAGLLFSGVMLIPVISFGVLGLSLWLKLFPGLPAWAILLAFFIAPLTYYRSIWVSIMLGLGRVSIVYRLAFFFSAINLIIILALGVSGKLIVDNVIKLSVALTVVNSGTAFALLYKSEPQIKLKIALLRDSLGYGFPLYLGFFINILHFRLDQLLVSNWIGTTALSQYAISAQWAEALFLIDGVVTSVSLQKVSSTSSEEGRSLTQQLLKWQFILMGGAGLALAIGAYPLINILYGKAYTESIIPLILLIPGSIAWSLAKIMSQYIYYNRGKKWTPTHLALFGLLANLAFTFILIKSFGLIGASIASTISYCILCGTTYVVYRWLK